MSKQILCTLGPGSLNTETIRRLTEVGVTLFRLNLSHTKIKDLPKLIQLVKQSTDVPLCLDSEGAQIRTGDMLHGACEFKEGALVAISNKRVLGNSNTIFLHPAGISKQFQVGDLVEIDFNSVVGQVVSVTSEGSILRMLNGGKVGSNKAVSVDRQVDLPPMTTKDVEAFTIGIEHGLTNFALSFANRKEDVLEVRKIVGNAKVISKIECKNGLRNLKEIIAETDAILIDRGDLSREEPIERIPFWQKHIIKQTKDLGKEVVVATNLLESMITNPYPTRAEVNDIYNTLSDGADGIVLAAETAIGKYPVGCVSMVRKLIHEFESHSTMTFEDSHNETNFSSLSLLNEPHGGQLVLQNTAKYDDCDGELVLSFSELLDCEQISNGAYSPVKGFMNSSEIDSVLDNNKLNNVVWTLPIGLQRKSDEVETISNSKKVLIKNENDQALFVLEVSSIEKIDIENYCQRLFGTTTQEHPGVLKTLELGEFFISGEIYKINGTNLDLGYYAMNPIKTRAIFQNKGWVKVIGFHTRNAAHQVHEFIQKEGLRVSGADGLLLHPVIGPKKKGDFLQEPIMKSYQTLMDFGYYPDGQAVLASFASYSRYAGPREAVFTAICRKNYGCSHFIMGRDHTGVGEFYTNIDLKSYFESLGNVGIEPVFFKAVGYCPATFSYKFKENDSEVLNISGTEARKKILNKEHLPDWFMREEVQDSLRESLDAGRDIFYE